MLFIDFRRISGRFALKRCREDEDHLASLAVAFPADALAHTEVYAVAPKNRSVLRLRLHQDDEHAMHTYIHRYVHIL